jgi:hypothetical protein
MYDGPEGLVGKGYAPTFALIGVVIVAIVLAVLLI